MPGHQKIFNKKPKFLWKQPCHASFLPKLGILTTKIENPWRGNQEGHYIRCRHVKKECQNKFHVENESFSTNTPVEQHLVLSSHTPNQ